MTKPKPSVLLKDRLRLLFCIFSLLSIGLVSQGGKIREMQQGREQNLRVIELPQFLNLLTSPMPPLIIDIRDVASFDEGHIIGAFHHTALDALPTNTLLAVVYGEKEGSLNSRLGESVIRRLRNQNVFRYNGGWREWLNSGLDKTFHPPHRDLTSKP